MREIRDNNLLLAVYGNSKDVPNGRWFYGSDKEPLQWGTQCLVSEGTVIQPHTHKVRNRQFKCKTTEVFVVLEGKLRADIYSLDKKKIESLVLHSGDYLVTYDGGHGFEALKKHTKFIEVKLGPFTSVEDDKEKW